MREPFEVRSAPDLRSLSSPFVSRLSVPIVTLSAPGYWNFGECRKS